MGIQIKNAALASHISWVVWALLNLYLLVGIVWNLIDPEDEKTANLPWWQRLLFIGFGVLSVAVSLVAPVMR